MTGQDYYLLLKFLGIRNISDLVKPIVAWKHWRPLKFKRKNFVLPVWLDKKSLHLRITILLKWTILIVATDKVSGPLSLSLSLEEGNSAWGLVLLWRWWQVRRQKIRDRSFFPLIQIPLREKCWHNTRRQARGRRRAMQHDHIGKFDLSHTLYFEYDHTLSTLCKF